MELKKTYITPKGTLKFPHIREADTRFDAEGKYCTSLVLDPNDPEAMAFLADIDGYSEQRKHKNRPYRDETDKEGNKTGNVEVKFGSSFKPGVFDAARQTVPVDIDPGNGTVAKIAFEPSEYTAFGGGVHLYLKAVQILELKEKSFSAEKLGFLEEEGWHPAPQEEFPQEDKKEIKPATKKEDDDFLPF